MFIVLVKLVYFVIKLTMLVTQLTFTNENGLVIKLNYFYIISRLIEQSLFLFADSLLSPGGKG